MQSKKFWGLTLVLPLLIPFILFYTLPIEKNVFLKTCVLVMFYLVDIQYFFFVAILSVSLFLKRESVSASSLYWWFSPLILVLTTIISQAFNLMVYKKALPTQKELIDLAIVILSYGLVLSYLYALIIYIVHRLLHKKQVALHQA